MEDAIRTIRQTEALRVLERHARRLRHRNKRGQGREHICTAIVRARHSGVHQNYQGGTCSKSGRRVCWSVPVGVRRTSAKRVNLPSPGTAGPTTWIVGASTAPMEVSRSLGPVDVRSRATIHPRRRLVGSLHPFAGRRHPRRARARGRRAWAHVQYSWFGRQHRQAMARAPHGVPHHIQIQRAAPAAVAARRWKVC